MRRCGVVMLRQVVVIVTTRCSNATTRCSNATTRCSNARARCSNARARCSNVMIWSINATMRCSMT